MASKSKLWACRMPGGPTKIIRSKRDLAERDVKEAYTGSFSFRSSEAVNDPDEPWPLMRAITDDELRKDYARFLDPSTVTGVVRGVVEV